MNLGVRPGFNRSKPNSTPETFHRPPERQADFHHPRLFARSGPRARRGKGRRRDHRRRRQGRPVNIVLVSGARRSRPVIPATRNGLPAMACVSAMQKEIWRGLEREAMEFAVELMHTLAKPG